MKIHHSNADSPRILSTVNRTFPPPYNGNRPPTSGGVSLAEEYDAFVENNRRVKNLAGTTHRYYHQQLSPFIDWCVGQDVDSVSMVTLTLVGQYLDFRRSSSLSDASIQAAYRALRSFFNFCVRHEILNSSPMKKMLMPRAEKRLKPILTKDEIFSLLNACTCARDQALLLFLLDSGTRSSEAVSVTGGDIDHEHGRVHIRLGKGRKDRYVYVRDVTLRALAKYYEFRGVPGPNDRVWLSNTSGNPLTQSGLNQMLRKLGRRAGIRNTNPHTFRRTFAVMSLENGIDLYRLAMLMGHSDIAVLKSYLPLVERHAREAHDQFGPLNTLTEHLDELFD